MAGVLKAIRILAAAGFGLGAAGAAAAESITLDGITFSDALDLMPQWAPDGQSVTYRNGAPRQGFLWSKRADGTGDA